MTQIERIESARIYLEGLDMEWYRLDSIPDDIFAEVFDIIEGKYYEINEDSTKFRKL